MSDSEHDFEADAKLYHKNAEYYRGLLDEVAKHLGPEVFVADDGSVMEDPLRAKIPELVERMSQRLFRAAGFISGLPDFSDQHPETVFEFLDT